MKNERRDPLIEEALRWLVVLNDPDVDDADRASFEAWLRTGPRHEEAWARAQAVWMRVGMVGPAFGVRRSDAADVVSSASAPLPVLSPSAQSAPRHTATRRQPSRRRLLYAAAASIAVVPAAFVLSRSALFADHATSVGERRAFSLDDGSTVELAGATSISVDFSETVRRVVLHAGEAFFDVAKESARPFIVQAAEGSTEALGTAFDVKRFGGEVTVAVVEHSVAVAASGGRVVVREGQQVRYGTRQQLGRVADADLAQVEGWRHDRLVFHETPLGEVIADLERYRGGRIVVTDVRLSRIPVTAVFDARQADAALETIANSLAIRLRRYTGFLAVLSPTIERQ